MIKRVVNIFFLLCFLTGSSQCPFDNTFLFDATPPCPGTFTVGCMNGGEYLTVNVIAGNVYTFTTCNLTTVDTQLSLYDQTGTAVLAFNDDACGLQSNIVWTATTTGTVNLLLDEWPCSNTGTCIDLEITCALPIQSGNGCNTNTTICTQGVAGPFGFSTPGQPVSSCLDFIGPNYAYIVLYITQSGPLEILINGDATTGFLDVAIFNVPSGVDPCTATLNTANEIGCNYATAASGCNQFGTFFPCASNLPSPNVTAGDVLMIVVENWSGASTTFTLDLGPPPAAQTGPPDPYVNPAGPYCNTDPPVQLTPLNTGGTFSGTGVSSSGVFDPSSAGIGSFNIDYSIGQVPCNAQSQTTIDVINCCTVDNLSATLTNCDPNIGIDVGGEVNFTSPPTTGQLIVENCYGDQQVFNPPFTSPQAYAFSGMPQNGQICDITAYFTAVPTCTLTIPFQSPMAPFIDAAPDTSICPGEPVELYIDSLSGGIFIEQFTMTFGSAFSYTTNNTNLPGTYYAVVSGTFSGAGPCEERDGGFWFYQGCNNINPIPAYPWQWNGANPNTQSQVPTVYNPNHVYNFYFNGGSSQTFSFQEQNASWYGDNSGSLTYQIFYLGNILLSIFFFTSTTTVTPTQTTTYSVTIDYGFGCTATDNVTVTVIPLDDPSFTLTDYCEGSSNTATNIITSGGIFSFDPMPSSGESINSLTGEITGGIGGNTYTIEYVTSGLCPDSITQTVTVNPLPAVGAGADQTVCDGIQVILTGSGAVSYTWDNGVTDGVAFTPTLGTTTYTVTGTDANNCVNTDQVDVTVNALPTVDAGTNQTVCDGTQVTLTGSGAVTYTWDNGVTDGVAFTPTLGTTTYTVTGTDANNCINTDQVDVTVNALPTVDAGSDQSVCDDGTQVTLTGSGAVTYTWDNGVTDGVSFTPTLGTITYTVTGTDVNNCVNTDQVDVTVNPLPAVNAGPDQTVCDGATVILTGTGAVSYSWDNGVTDGMAFTPTLGTTTYIVTGTDANNCVNTDQVDVTVNPLPAVSAGVDQTVCDGSTVTLTGSGAVSYTWDNGVTDGVAFTPTLGTTTYIVTGTDANNCVNTDQVDVTVNALPTVDAGPDQSVCDDGTQVTLTGTGAVSYSWDNGVTDGVSFTPTLGTITYTVTGTDVNNCVNTDQVDVTVNPLPAVNAGPDQTVCDGATVTLTGTGAVSYSWDNGVTDGMAFTPTLGTTTYEVTGTDANNCVNTDQVDVTVNPIDDPAFTLTDFCEGTTLPATNIVTPGGTFAFNPIPSSGETINPLTGEITGGIGGTTYSVEYTTAGICPSSSIETVTVTSLDDASFVLTDHCEGTNNGATNIATPGGTFAFNPLPTSGETINPLSAQISGGIGGTTYTIEYTTPLSACQNSSTETITIFALPIVDAGVDQTVCDGATVILSGSGAVSYTWDNGVTDGVAFTPTLGTTTYTVTGTDANNCVNTDQADVTVNPLPIVDAGLDQIVCDDGTQVTLTGSGAISYTWDNGVTDGVAFAPTLGTTTYTVTGTDANNCINTDDVDITVNALPLVSAGADQTVCIGSSITLSGTGAVSYTWDNGVTDGVSFTINSPTTYTVTGTDANNCVNTDDVTISISDPSYVDNIQQSTCGNPDGEITLIASNGIPNYQYSIDGGATFQSSGVFPGLMAGLYNIVIEDAIGCQVTGQVSVTDQGGPIINGTTSLDVLCLGSCDGSISINATGATQFSIDNGVTFQVLNTFTGLCAGTYDIVVENAIGCEAFDQAVIGHPTAVTATITQVDPLCFGDLTGEIDITAMGGTPNYQYSNDNGITFQALNVFPNLPAGTYDVIVKDANNCQTLGQNIMITEPPELTMTLGVTDATCCTSCNGMINSIPAGGTGPGTYSYAWTPSSAAANLPLAMNLCAGNYSLTVTDANNCSITANADILCPQTVTINNIAVIDELCAGDCMGSFTISASNATQFSIDGVNFQSSNVFNNLCAGIYTIYAQDAIGCGTTIIDTIESPAPITIQSFGSTTICIGGSATLDAQLTGGVGGYSYSWDNGMNTQQITVSPTLDQTYCVTGTDANGCVSGQSCVTVTVNPSLSVQAQSDQTICMGDGANITATANGGDGGPYTYTWDQGVGVGQNQTVNPTATTVYTVTVTDGCQTPAATSSVTITVTPLPLISFSGDDLEGCMPLDVTFTDVNVPAGSQYSWNFGDGSTSSSSGTVSHTYTTPGCWDVGLEITTPDGCVASFDQLQYICVYEYPTAAFTFGPQPTTIVETEINFENNSTGATNYLWVFDTQGAAATSTQEHPSYVFPANEEGSYEVCLDAISIEGCVSTICKTVVINDVFLVYVPNAFTPGGSDLINNEFMPIVNGVDILEYEFYIFNRWGELVFESHHPEDGWDGTYMGKMAQQDAYVWKLIVVDEAMNLVHQYKGHVILLGGNNE